MHYDPQPGSVYKNKTLSLQLRSNRDNVIPSFHEKIIYAASNLLVIVVYKPVNPYQMIDNALHAVAGELNAYLIDRFKVQEDKAMINTILNQDGSIPEHCMNKVILSLINLEHESTARYNPVYLRNKDAAEQVNQPYNFNIDLLVTALFADYNEGLKFLSEAIYFFHAKPVFNHKNSVGLDPLIQQLSFELIRLSYHETHSLWGALGAKYMPSIPFKIRMLSFQSNTIVNSIPVITASSPTTQPK